MSQQVINIVMVEPEIPPNTGNVSRLCAATGSSLHLVRPLGFFLDDKRVKRAGLDYWELLDLRYHDSLDAMLETLGTDRMFFASTKGKVSYTDVSYQPGDFLVFGPETRGLPESLLNRYPQKTIRIPMIHDNRARSLNLSNSVSIVLYEALRQTGFQGLG